MVDVKLEGGWREGNTEKDVKTDGGEKGFNSVILHFSNNLQFQIAAESNSLSFRERPQET